MRKNPQQLHEEVLDTEEAAAYLHMSARTLEDWRSDDRGPAYCKLGPRGRVYRIEDLRAWLVSRRVETSDTKPEGATDGIQEG